MKSPIAYYGGKSRMARHIIPILEEIPHTLFVEGFAGSAAIMYGKRRVRNEVVNDLHNDLVNFYEVLRDNPEVLHRKLKMTPYSRSVHRWHTRNYLTLTDPIDRAWSYFIRTQYSFSKQENGTFGFVRDGNIAKTTANRVDHLLAATDRLRGVTIECDTWEKTLARYDADYSLFYMDPPYPGTVQKYQHQFSHSDMCKMVAALESAKCSVVVSCYNAESWFDNQVWEIRKVSTKCTASSSNKLPRTECICIKKYSLPAKNQRKAQTKT